MGWSRNAKFSIHSGRTLRRQPTRKYCIGSYFGSNKTNRYKQFAVVKELQLEEQDNYISRNKVNFEFDDGIPLTGNSFRRARPGRPDYPRTPVIYSLNKHKRWLLPDLLKEGVEKQYETETKEIADLSKKDGTESDKLQITVVERHTSPYVGRGRGDCFGLTSNCPATKPTPVRKPTKAHAHVGDLISKRDSERDAELYYELLSPYPKNRWPSHQQVNCYTRYEVGEVVGSKSKKKGKGRRNKHYRHGVPQDEPIDCRSYVDVDHMNNIHEDTCTTDYDAISENCGSNFSFPLGACIDAAIKTKTARSSKNNHLPGLNHCSQTCTLGDSYQFGKGDAVYLEIADDQSLGLLFSPDEKQQNPEEWLSEDRKLNIQLLAESIRPNDLKQEFGDDYIEDAILPRKFIIKADLNKTLPNMFTNDCCLLFEISDFASMSEAVVDVKVTLLLPTTNELSTEKVAESVELELIKLKSSAPLTVKDTVSLVAEKIVQESRCLPKSFCVRRNPVNPDTCITSVNFIHDICQEKPEICLSKQAVQHSMTEVDDVLKQQVSSSRDESVKKTDSLCEICLLDMDQDQGVTSFTCLLQCSHGFCNGCWKHYIISCVQAGQSRILCPDFNCHNSVGDALVWSSTNSKFYQMYAKVSNQLAVDTNPALQPCPAPGCDHLAYVASAEKKAPDPIPVLCHCGELWCFACQNNAHWPASCREAEAFRKAHGNYEALKRISVVEGRITSIHVKRCPFCFYPIDKSMGCQHMSCRCGNEFCWDCLEPWNSHGSVCNNQVKDLEEVELVVSIGNARYDKYWKVSLHNFQARNGKYFSMVRKLVQKAKRVENSHKLVSDSETAPSSRLVRSYVESSISTHVEIMFHFKYLAHFVLENTAAAMAVSKRKTTLKSLDKKIQKVEFIIGRINEFILEPIMLSDEKNLEKAKMLLTNGERLIKSMHALVQLNRN